LLAQLGWTPALEEHFVPYAAERLEPARVAVEHRDAYVTYTTRGERQAELSGRLRHAAAERGDLPAVGDWVAVTPTDPALVQAVLPRGTKFSRMAANDHGQTIEQVVAANVDVVFLTAGLDGDFQRLPARAVPHARLGERSLARRRPHEARPLRGPRSRAARGRVSRDRRSRPRGVERHRRRRRRARVLPDRRPDGGRARLVRRGEVVPRQPAGRRGADGDGGRPRRGPRAPHDHEPPAPAPARRGPVPRHARDARAAALGLGRGTGHDLRRRRRCSCAVPLQRLLARVGAVRAALADAMLDHERYVSWRKLQNEHRWLELKQDARLRSEARKEWRRFARSQRKASW
jgi:hypothetical protein